MTAVFFTKRQLAIIYLLISCTAFLSSSHAQNSATDNTESFSRTNQILFFDDHLGNTQAPASLNYQFVKSSTLENDESFSDTVTVRLEQSGGSGKNASVEYFTGERKRFAPEFSDVKGNPILTIALQRDVYQMERILDNGIGWRHFQKRLKLAFENSAEVSDVDLTLGDKTIRGQQIVIRPFTDDPLARRFPKFKDKTYVFTLSDAVPGHFYRIETIVDDGETGLKMQETYTFSAS